MRYLVMAALLAMATPAAAGGLGDILKGNKNKPVPTAPSAPPGTPPPTAPAVNSDKAKVEFDIAEIELQASKLYVAGLADLASKPSTWDKESTIHLFNQAQQTVISAEQELGQLEPLAVGNWAKAQDNIRRARSELVSTEQQLRGFSTAVRSGQYQAGDPAGIKNLWGSIDRAQKDVEGAAATMGVDVRLKGL